MGFGPSSGLWEEEQEDLRKLLSSRPEEGSFGRGFGVYGFFCVVRFVVFGGRRCSRPKNLWILPDDVRQNQQGPCCHSNAVRDARFGANH
jgi:hypothetical protein